MQPRSRVAPKSSGVAIIDLTLSRIDSSLFTGTPREGDLTELEMQWGRTIGQMPSPYTGRNPLMEPYHFDQGPSMHLNRGIKIQLAIFSIVSLIAALIMVFGYIKLPVLLFGMGRYTVTVDLPRSGGLCATGNLTYRGVEVGRFDAVKITPDGVAATLSLKSGIDIPAENWKGDPNATLSGQPIPQPITGSAAMPPQPEPRPIDAVPYDPATGTYIGPDGKTYTQSNLAQNAPSGQTRQSMMAPPSG